MKKSGLHIIVMLTVIAAVLSGCRSSRQTGSGTGTAEPNSGSYAEVASVLAQKPAADELTARISVSADMGSLGGQIRMRWNECVQLSVNLLGLAEIARVEFLPDKVVMIDRVNRRYSVCGYADFPGRNYTGLEFDVVQRLFWNRLFAPGQNGVSDMVSAMSLKEDGTDSMILQDREYGYQFSVRKLNSLLTSVSKRVQDSGVSMGYSAFTRVSGNMVFPTVLDLDIDSDELDLEARIVLSDINISKGSWESQSRISSNLKKVDIDELIKSLLQ